MNCFLGKIVEEQADTYRNFNREDSCMKCFISEPLLSLLFTFSLVFISCTEENKVPSAEMIQAMNLKKGSLVTCGPAGNEYGSVDFDITAPQKTKKDFNLALSLLHSFEYDDAEKVFGKIINGEPACAMAYWGVAMSNYHPLWAPPTPKELAKGAKAINIAKTITKKSIKESEYIEALASFYEGWQKTPHSVRVAAFEKAMEQMHAQYPGDKETAIFYALALNASADPTDKTYSKQKKAGKILDSLYISSPQHPGIVHYIIHSYDYPELANRALPAARKYASIAPSSAHAQHMPSHVFTRLGLWDENIQSNIASVSAAKCYAENTGLHGHWDEELHGLDYLVYAYLQKGDTANAKKYWEYLKTIRKVEPENFKVAYAFAAIPARYVLENKLWQQAADLQLYPSEFPWEKYPWQKAIFHFSRTLGNIHLGNMQAAKNELAKLEQLHNILISQKDNYKANQVQVQIKTSRAWILFKSGNKDDALKLMREAADLEDNTPKHPVTPGEVLPARELLGDMLLEMNKPREALDAYHANLKNRPNRLNSLKGIKNCQTHNQNSSLAL